MDSTPLPVVDVDGLWSAYTEEVAERLPRLEAAVLTLPADLRDVTRDAHTLGSSSFLVGADHTAHAARAAERALVEGDETVVPLLQALVALLHETIRQGPGGVAP